MYDNEPHCEICLKNVAAYNSVDFYVKQTWAKIFSKVCFYNKFV